MNRPAKTLAHENTQLTMPGRGTPPLLVAHGMRQACLRMEIGACGMPASTCSAALPAALACFVGHGRCDLLRVRLIAPVCTKHFVLENPWGLRELLAPCTCSQDGSGVGNAVRQNRGMVNAQ